MNLQKMMKQAQDMQTKIGQMQAELEETETEGSSGGGAVRVLMTGKGIARKVTLDKSVIDPNDKEMLEDLIVAAINDARNKIDIAFNEKMGSVTSGMKLPPGMKLPF